MPDEAPVKITVEKEAPTAEAWTKATRSTFGYSGDNLSCILEINGELYRDWETVSVKLQIMETPYHSFRFTCSEGVPLVKNYAKLRIRPGDICTVKLAGIVAVHGYVSTRQVFYDAQRHYIEIQGVSNVDNLQHAFVAHKTMEFKNVTYEQYARELLRPTAIKMLVKGGVLPQTVFPRISVAHGSTIMEALEQPLRSYGNFPFGSTARGDLVVHAAPVTGQDVLVEGKNILEGREIIFSETLASRAVSVGQAPGTNKKYGADVAQQVVNMLINGWNMYTPHVMPLETPSFRENFLKGRVNMEHDTMANDQITVFATVHGWLKPSGGLWEEGKTARVKSPMLIMDGEIEFTIKSVTFTQDNAHGSRTVIELMNQQALRPGVPQDPGPDPATTPAEQQTVGPIDPDPNPPGSEE